MTRAFSMIPLPVERSQEKPRRKGLTMMMDWGIPVEAQADLLGLVAPYVDLAKLVVGTARLYEEDYLRRKLDCYREHRISPFIGGQFLEYVYRTQGQDGVKPFCVEARRLGIEAIEVSDNVVTISSDTKQRIVATARDAGLEVHGEVGSKSEASGPEALIAQAKMFFQAGAHVVLVEGAELLREGKPDQPLIDALRSSLEVERVIFELSGTWIPNTRSTDVYALKAFLVNTFGPDVNLANILPNDVWETEALRAGLSVPGPPG